MTHIAIVGSINIDLTAYLERWPAIGETVRMRKSSQTPGGKGANQYVAAAKLSGAAIMIGAIGKDSFGLQADAALTLPGGTLQLIKLDQSATGMAMIDVVPDGSNIIRITDGANGALLPAHIQRFATDITSARVLLLQNEIPFATSLSAARLARSAGVTIIMDPAPAPQPMWSKQDLSAFDIITPNAGETALITGTAPKNLTDAREAAQAMSRQFDLRGAIVTMGEMGAAWAIEQSTGSIAAPKVNTIDTVAAGDCFNGALAAALMIDLPYDKAIACAVHAAALATTKTGASRAMPDKSQLQGFLDQQNIAILPV